MEHNRGKRWCAWPNVGDSTHPARNRPLFSHPVALRALTHVSRTYTPSHGKRETFVPNGVERVLDDPRLFLDSELFRPLLPVRNIPEVWKSPRREGHEDNTILTARE